MRILLSLICMLPFLYCSCDGSGETKKYLSRIDSLSITLEKSASAFENVDTAIIHTNYQLIDHQLEILFDTYNNYDPTHVYNYSVVRNIFFDFISNYPEVTNELAYTRSQLSDLKYDVEHNKLDREQVHLYFSQEKQSVNVLKLKMNFYLEQLETGMHHFDNIYPEMEKRIDSLNQ